jgi:tetratricopeptide (TPR) repeat protein
MVLCALLGFPRQGGAQVQSIPPAPGKSSASNDQHDLSQIEAMIQQGRIPEAKAAVLAYLERHPSSVEAYNILGIIDSNQQNLTDALAAFQRALKIAPNSAKTHVNLGNVYIAQKRMDLAEKEFRLVLRVAPQDQTANYDLGVLLMAKGAFAQAIPCFQHVHPSNVATSFNLIRAYFEIKQSSEALRLATELSARNENSVQVHFSLGVLLASESQPKAAQPEFLKADALQPETFDIVYNLGIAFQRSGDNPRAELTLSHALKLKPDSAETLYWLAKAEQAEARPLDALDSLVRAHSLAPDNIDILFLMAQISISQNYYEDAIPLLESGLKLAPNRSDFRAALGESYFMAGKVDQAVAEFKKLIEAEPSARSYAFLGLSYRNLGRFDEASQNFQKGLKIDPNNIACKFNLGFIAERQGDTATAESRFQEVLRADPDYPEALLELANLRTAAKQLPEARELLKRYVRVSRSPATGYYKLAMVERSLHETAASDRDLTVFQTLSKDTAPAAHYYEHLFDYLDTRSKLAPEEREQLDLNDITEQIKKHPDQPEALYLLVGAYLKAGKLEEAKGALAQLDKVSSGDYRSLTGVGVLLARYRLYDEAIQHFQAAIAVNPESDEEQFDLADAYFRKGLYSQALDAMGHVSEQGRKDDAYLALLGDIDAHLGDTDRAESIYRDAISRNPDNDQDYLSLSLLEFRKNDIAAAKETLLKGQSRIPGSGKIIWGLAIASALEGKTPEAAARFERAVELLPEWSGSYSTLGVFYYETGQIDKAREVLNRFKNTHTSGGLDISRIDQVLAQSPATTPAPDEPMTMAKRQQLLQLALSLSDRTL